MDPVILCFHATYSNMLKMGTMIQFKTPYVLYLKGYKVFHLVAKSLNILKLLECD